MNIEIALALAITALVLVAIIKIAKLLARWAVVIAIIAMIWFIYAM